MQICMRCGTPREGLELRCPRCGGPFKVEPDQPYNPRDHKSNFPYIREWIDLGQWNTPMIKVSGVYMKLDGLNPTGSYKDRGAVTLISSLRASGLKRISEDSSGNAGASIAAYGAAAGMEVTIFVPANASGLKVRQIETYGAQVVKVKGRREDVAAAASVHNSFYASHVLNPEFRDGIRTLAYEIVRDLSGVPDVVIVPLSAGTLLLGLYEGFNHMLNTGFTDHIPKIIAVQPEKVMPVCTKLRGIPYTPPEVVNTVADALVSTSPLLMDFIVEVLQKSGSCEVVREDEIVEARRELSRLGILAEYSSATTYAAYKRLRPEGKVVLHISGNGLKNL